MRGTSRTSSNVPRALGRLGWFALAVVPLVAACQNTGIPSPAVITASLNEPEPEAELDHIGPRVELAETGPARFVRLTYNGFKTARAMETVAFLDERYRTAGSTGFDESLDLIEEQLRAAGFGTRPELELVIYESELEAPSWEGKSGSISMQTVQGGEALLHSFSAPADLDRCLLPENAPSCDVNGAIALGLDSLQAGQILVTEASPRRDLLMRAKRKGAVALVSASSSSYNTDPTGRERHLDGIQFRSVDSSVGLPIAMISPRSYAKISAAFERDGGVNLRLKAEVELGDKRVRTIVATIVGATRPMQTVVLPSHVLAPGASDNASGAAGLLEAAITLSKIIDRHGLDRPARSLTFIWGPELLESEVWLANTERTPIAAVHPVMIGQSRAETGAVPLLERAPDPGAVEVIPPDMHTLWGSREVDDEWLVPNGLAIIARCAFVDVARHVGGWETFENPYEGGTDHDVFIKLGIPAVLFWHFTDFTFHTSLDRLGMVDGEELHRMAVAALSTALAIADPKPTDLDRYLKSMLRAKHVRLQAALNAEEPEVAEAWDLWYSDVRQWFRVHCLGLEGEEGVLPKARVRVEETDEGDE